MSTRRRRSHVTVQVISCRLPFADKYKQATTSTKDRTVLPPVLIISFASAIAN